jgi:hypothetical protein
MKQTLLSAAAMFVITNVQATSQNEAHVTQIVREVNVLEKKSAPRPATVNERVGEGEAVRTGDQSRSELTFADLTIERLGANSTYSFNKGGRDVQLNSGSILLRVPKDSGGASIHTSAVTVAITGTTLILETMRAGRSKLIVLEGAAQLSLAKNRSLSRRVRSGQMLDVPAGAVTLPEPVEIDLNQVLRTHPLIVGFPPLPSQPLIVEAANNQRNPEPVYAGVPVGPGPGRIPRIPPAVTGNYPPPNGGGGGGRSRGGGTATGNATAPAPVTAAPGKSSSTPRPQIGRTAPRRASSSPTPPPIR